MGRSSLERISDLLWRGAACAVALAPDAAAGLRAADEITGKVVDRTVVVANSSAAGASAAAPVISASHDPTGLLSLRA